MNLASALTLSQPVIVTVPSGQKGLLLNNQSSATIIIKSPIREILSVLPGLALTSPVREGENLEFYFSGTLETGSDVDISFSKTTTNLTLVPISNVPVDTSLTPKTKDQIYKNTDLHTINGILTLGTFDISKYTALNIVVYPGFTLEHSLQLELGWYDNPNPSEYVAVSYDIKNTRYLVTSCPTISQYINVVVYDTAAETGIFVLIYGLQTKGIERGSDFPYLLSQGNAVSIAAGTTFMEYLATWVGRAQLHVSCLDNAKFTIQMGIFDYTDTQTGLLYHNINTTKYDVFEPSIMMPPSYCNLSITNNDTVAHDFYWSLINAD